MGERDFWQAVYIAAVFSGATADEANDTADAAVAGQRYRWESNGGYDPEPAE